MLSSLLANVAEIADRTMLDKSVGFREFFPVAYVSLFRSSAFDRDLTEIIDISLSGEHVLWTVT